jgi:hypothetical protein
MNLTLPRHRSRRWRARVEAATGAERKRLTDTEEGGARSPFRLSKTPIDRQEAFSSNQAQWRKVFPYLSRCHPSGLSAATLQMPSKGFSPV